MLEVLATAVEAGATTLNIPDTVGYGIPWDYGDLLTHVRSQVAGDYVISTHCHNDLGLAVANSLSGVRAGRPPGRGLRQRAGRARRQRRPRGGGHGAQDPRRPVPRPRDEREDQGAGPDEPDGGPSHGLPGAVEQGGRGQERLRPRVGHPPARRAQGALDLRDHRRGLRRPRGRPDHPRQAHRAPRLRGHPGKARHHRPGRRPERRLRPLQGAGGPQGAADRRRPRGDRRRGARDGARRGLRARRARRPGRHDRACRGPGSW